jgi:hypothetical protein
METHSTGPAAGPLHAVRDGWCALVASSPLVKALVAALFLLTCLMLPVGRKGPADGGGLLAPLTVDSGLLFRTRPATDFFSVYDAGAHALRGGDPFAVNRDTGRAGVRAPYVATFRYLPITAYWLAVPLNILPPWPSFYTWVVLNVVFVWANFLLCAGRNPAALPVFAVLWFAWFPLVAELHMGQFSLFMGTLLLWGFDSLCCGRKWGGVGWVLAVLLKVYPIAMAPSLWCWKKRGPVITVVAIAVLSTLPWLLSPSEIGEGLGNRGVSGRIIGGIRQPYAGAQGVQEAIDAIIWKGAGLSFGDEGARPVGAGSFYMLVSSLVLAAYGALCLYALIVTRRRPSIAAIGLFWMTWFVAYRDCWEHHYVLLQALVGFLLAWRRIGGRFALLLWCFAGAPSLWWLWQRTGYSGTALTESIGLLYFLQRPLAIVALTVVLARQLGADARE